MSSCYELKKKRGKVLGVINIFAPPCINYISGYNILERGHLLIEDATRRWDFRKSHTIFNATPLPSPSHKLKYAPKSLSRYICMLNRLKACCINICNKSFLDFLWDLRACCIKICNKNSNLNFSPCISNYKAIKIL